MKKRYKILILFLMILSLIPLCSCDLVKFTQNPYVVFIGGIIIAIVVLKYSGKNKG